MSEVITNEIVTKMVDIFFDLRGTDSTSMRAALTAVLPDLFESLIREGNEAHARGVAEGLKMAREIAETVRATAQDGVTRTSSATATTRTFQESLANYLEAGAVYGARDIIAFIDARLSAIGNQHE